MITRLAPVLARTIVVVAGLSLGGPVAAQTALRQELSSFGITWTFDKSYPTGQFANGDWWVVGPVEIISIDPPSRSGSRVRNGSQINPSPRAGKSQGYDSAVDKNIYAKNLNVALDVSPAQPLIVPQHSSLVSTISVEEPNQRPQLRGASILTVLPRSAQPGDFRPPFCGSDKTIKFNASQLRYHLLHRLKSVGNGRSLASVERLFERPWLEHIPDWEGKYIHPKDNYPYYGRDLASHAGIGALTLHLDYSNEQKRTLLIRYVQMGIDKQGVADDGGHRNWIENGGHNHGRKWPILFAGLMLNDPHMMGVGSQNVMFQEDRQTYYISQDDIKRTGHPQSDLGKAMWGQRHTSRPWTDQLWGKDPYQMCCTMNAMRGVILAARLMDVVPLWKHDALFDYMDRYARLTLSQSSFIQSWDEWTLDMWNAYRPTVGQTWRLKHRMRVASAFGNPTGTHSVKPPPQEIHLEWNAPQVNGVHSYRIHRGASATSLELIGKGVTEQRFTDPTVAGGKTWYYVVSGVDANEKEIARSAPLEVRT